MAGRLDGRVAVVTGASSGIGEATVRALATEGAAVMAGARRRERLGEVVERVSQDGGKAIGMECDVTDEEQAHDLVRRAVEEFGRIDILVNKSSLAGRKVRVTGGVYSGTKFAVNAISEALRMELLEDNIRVTVVEAGAVDTELATHITDEEALRGRSRFEGIEILEAEDIANTIAYAALQPERVSINEVLMRPTRQEN